MDLIMGMNSGSSFDGIDVVLVETEIDSDGFPKVPKFIKGGSYQWPEDVKNLIFDSFENKVDMIGLNRLNYMVGAIFADAAKKFIKENKINSEDIKVLGLDTQTLYQESPDHRKISEMTPTEKDNWLFRWTSENYPAGYQIGDTSVIANLTNIDTVTHFRQADHTFGGNAAPLMPYLDFILFRKEKKPVMTLNIGGIANLHLAASDRKKMYGFDTGPGNVISDYFVKKLFHQNYDKNGEIAASGKVNEDMMARKIFGIDKIESGEIYINGSPVRIKSPKDAIKNGIGLVPEDRKEYGLVLGMSVRDNILVSKLTQLKNEILNMKLLGNITKSYISKFNIVLGHENQQVRDLSGGNQQKVVIAKWLTMAPNIIILDEPTRGIDIGTKNEIYLLINQLKEQGMSIILMSSEIEEILNICDRVLVMHEGSITNEFQGEHINKEDIIYAAIGG